MINGKRGRSSRIHGRKDSGVSEIIGDILILGITVVLFTSIFFYVSAIPTPSSQTYADFHATVSGDVPYGATTVAYLNITHLGGQSLNAATTSIVVQVNQTATVYLMVQGNAVNSAGRLIPWTSSSWGANQVWSVNSTGVNSGSVVSVTIINKASNSVVWSTVLSGVSTISIPVIQNAYASPNPVMPGRNVTVIASVLGNVKYVNASVYYLNNAVGTLRLTGANGIYSGVFESSSGLAVGQTYPVQINATSANGARANYTFSVSVERGGPNIVTASINPNPATPGIDFNVTAYIIDSNSSQFNPAAGLGTVTIKPYGQPVMTNITQAVEMKPTEYSGIYSYEGSVNLSTYGIETFIINATDILGTSAVYYLQLVVINGLNPSAAQNSSYPSTYLGPTSMTFSNFKWYPMGQPQNAVSGYSVSLSSAASGIYFQLELTNHNTTDTLYLEDLTNIYFFAGAQPGFSQAWSFIVLNGTHGASYMTPAQNSNGYQSNTYGGTTQTYYPSLGWDSSTSSPTTGWNNYSIPTPTKKGSSETSMSSTSFLTLPAAIGGVQVGVQVVFGASVSGSGSGGSTSNVPATSGGPFTSGLTGSTSPFISANFVELFGYLLPYQTMPWKTFPTSGTPYGQTIPFTGIFWS